MSRILVTVLLVVAAFAVLSRCSLDDQSGVGGLFTDAGPCERPLAFHLEAVDPRFDLDQTAVRDALMDAVRLWRTATDRPLFRETASRGMAVTLIYDERQARAERRAANRADMAGARRELATDEQRLANRQADFEAARDAFEERLADHRAQRARHEEAVAAWNAGEMARTEANRERLNRRAAELNAESEALSERQAALAERLEGLRADRDALAGRAEAFNERVAEYNTDVAATRGFQMAHYEREGENRVIRVFKASDADELRLALAHELGHALGIGHVDEPQALMNAELGPANRGRRTLSDADRAALVAVCEGS